MHQDIPFDHTEYNFFSERLKEFKKDAPKHLAEVISPMKGIRFFWRKDMEVNGRDGRYKILSKKCYFDLRYRKDSKSKILVMPTLGHELCHDWWLGEYGYINFALTNLPWIRDKTQHQLCWAVEDAIVQHFNITKRDFR